LTDFDSASFAGSPAHEHVDLKVTSQPPAIRGQIGGKYRYALRKRIVNQRGRQ